MDKTFGDLLRSAEQSPSYWMQVALLEFLQSLDAMMEAKGRLSRKELADRIGVSPATLSRWLNGNENITVSTMCRLATAMGAAVHIHVADNKERGRWRPEVGTMNAKDHKPQVRGDKVVDMATFKAQRRAAVAIEASGTDEGPATLQGGKSRTVIFGAEAR
jgi:transcriptional regulator with XRE-family HTH domain